MMKNFTYPSLCITGMLAAFTANAQDPQRMSLEDAVSYALEHNYDVRVAGISKEAEQNLADRGNAGFLPSVYIDGNAEYLLQNTNITFAGDGLEPIQADGAQTINFNGAAIVSYTLYNGGRRVHLLRSLEAGSEDARLREKLAMESTSLQVAQRYLEALRLSDALAIAEEAVTLSLERDQRARENYQYGIFTRLQLLNAEVDLRSDSIALASATLELKNALRELKLAMGMDASVPLNPDSTLRMEARLDRNELLNQASLRNTAYMRARNEVFRAGEDLKTLKADLYPTLSTQGGYRYNYSDYEANFLRTQENYGWNAGLNLRFYLFDGGRVRRNIDNARLNVAMAEVEEARTLHEVNTFVNNAYDSYLTSIELLALSKRNLNLAKANYERSKEAFGSGQITGTELRDAQLNLTRSRNEISVRRINSKLAELALLFEAGMLLD